MEKTPESSRITVRIADDRLSAFVTVRAGLTAGARELESALESAQVRAGIDSGVFSRLALGLADPNFEIARELVARGSPPKPGQDGKFEPQFREGIQPGHVREDGTLDLHDRELLKPVEKGDVVGRFLPAQPGVTGFLVDATPLVPEAVRDALLSLGAGVERDAQGVVRALRAGVVDFKPAKSLDVVDHHVHAGPVDIRSGHLHMQGSLVVKGDVERSFSVYASGDIEIRGNVDNGSVVAGGDVRVKHGVRGGDGGTVRADGNLSVHHAEAAVLYAGRLLHIGEAVHCELVAGRVEVAGRLRGGRTSAEFSIVARELGSAQGLETELVAAEPLELPVENAQRALEREKALRVGKVGVSRAQPGSNERTKGGKLGRVQASFDGAELARLAERARRRESLSQVAFIQVGIAHPGVKLHIAGRELSIEHEIRASRFSLDAETRELRTDKIVS